MTATVSPGRSARLTPNRSKRVRLSALRDFSELTANGSFSKVTDSSAVALEVSASLKSCGGPSFTTKVTAREVVVAPLSSVAVAETVYVPGERIGHVKRYG